MPRVVHPIGMVERGVVLHGAPATLVGLAHITPHAFQRCVGTQLAKRDIRKAQRALGQAEWRI